MTTSFFDSNSLSSSYSYGSGNNQINNGVSITGTLSSGQSTRFDLTSISQNTFNSNQSIPFTGIKHISVYNKSDTDGYEFTVMATGTNACTNLFNGGSGNLLIKPYSSFSYNSPYTAFITNTGQRYLYLTDTGSGTSYKIMILGLT
jgi:hypothetical protein